jgi:hypothetical protein
MQIYTRLGFVAFTGEEKPSDTSSRTPYVTSGTTNYENRNMCGFSGHVNDVEDHKDIFGHMVTEQDTQSPNPAILDDTLLAGALAHFQGLNSSKWKIQACQSAPLEPYGIAFRKDDRKFRSKLEGAWNKLKEKNEICELYNLWFREPKIKPLMEELYNSEGRAAGSEDLYKLCNSQ